jgi:peptide deformylase
MSSQNSIKILTFPHPFLAKKTIVVKSLKDAEVKKTILYLKTAMEENNGKAAGLSANQIGREHRIFAYKEEKGGEVFIVINPEIISKKNEYVKSVEGCLSFPNQKTRNIKRFSEITVKYSTESGKTITEKIVLDERSRKLFIWQHEIDHLDGILFNQTDKIWDK